MTGPDRLITETERGELRRLGASALKRHSATAREFAELTGFDASSLSKCLNLTNPANADHFMPVDRAAEFDRWLGEPVFARALARLAGHALIPLPDIDPEAAGGAEAAATLRELGETITAIADALADDGRLGGSGDADADRAELDRLIAEGEEGLDALASLIRWAKDKREAVGKTKGDGS